MTDFESNYSRINLPINSEDEIGLRKTQQQ